MTSPTFRGRGSCSRTSCLSWRTPNHWRRPSTTWRSGHGRSTSTTSSGAEARGFILGSALAYRLGSGFVCARKPGKLPYLTVGAKYALEYGFDALEMHVDALPKGARVLVHDDLLATGGTAKAKIELVEQLGAEVVGLAFVVELTFLGGRDKLYPYLVHSLISYDS